MACRLTRHAPRLAALPLLLACDGQRWVVSDSVPSPDDAGLVVDATACESSTQRSPDETPGLPGTQHWGTYQGTLSGTDIGSFPTGRLTLTVSASGGSSLQFSDWLPLMPPTNGSGGYLCQAPPPARCVTESRLVGGFAYSLLAVRSRGPIFTFSVSIDQPWDSWCRLQSPHPWPSANGCTSPYRPEPEYAAPQWGDECSVERDGERIAMDCTRLFTLESNPCECDALGCAAAKRRLLEMGLRLTEANALGGSLWFDNDHAVQVTFNRQ